MKYLISLKNDLLSRFLELTGDNTQLQIINGELPPDRSTIHYVARFYLLNCRLPNPFDILGFIRRWFEHHGKPVPKLTFDCDVVNLETYDLQIDISLDDKLNFADDGTASLCDDLVWSDTAGTYVKASIVYGDTNG